MNLVAGEFGFGIQSEALPAGKYWSKQVGMTREMARGHQELLESGRADYVIAYSSENSRQIGFTTEYIRTFGYEAVDSLTYVDYKGHWRTTIIYEARGKR